jgi:ribosome-associated toxin RatA of RatAB toxin-antitoxin module
LEGPFERLEGTWHFRSEKDGKSRIDLDLRFRFADHGLGVLFDSVFKNAMGRILDAFKERARSLYGSPGTG